MDEFSQNLLRVIAAELHLLNGMTAGREMFGKSYFALGIAEKAAVDKIVQEMIASNYLTVMTPESLALQTSQHPMGFRPEPKS